MEVRIVVVDDDRANGVLLRRMLEHAGYADVVVTDDAARAVELCRTERTGLLLLDLHLRGAEGSDVIAAVRSSDRDLPIIVVTGDVSEGARRAALEAGADDFLIKPFGLEDLLGLVFERVPQPGRAAHG